MKNSGEDQNELFFLESMNAFLLAVRFLTCIPVPERGEFTPQGWGRSALAYPLVGFMIGALLLGLQRLVGHADPLLQAALLTAAWAMLTGGLHLDGLADSADAWVGGHGDRERTMAIMKDPRSGPAAVSTLALTLLLKFAALAALARIGAGSALLLAPLLARSSLVVLLLTTPYVRAGGMGAAISAHLPRIVALLVLLLVAAGAVFAGKSGVLALVTVLALLAMLRWIMMRRLGGMTGDTLGATVELTEVAVLVVLALAE